MWSCDYSEIEFERVRESPQVAGLVRGSIFIVEQTSITASLPQG
jgi:hypothetical protein